MHTDGNPRAASTVVLARDRDGALQIYLLRRSPKSAFMPGSYVFPGGTVGDEDRNAEFWRKHVDRDPDWVSASFGGGLHQDEALAHCVAAIRETFEEAGVLLTDGAEGVSACLKRQLSRRETRELKKGWFTKWVEEERLILALSGLSRWAHWLTPKLRSRRYDTRFFVAFLPSDQRCSPDNRETTQGVWVGPREGLEANLRGELPLSPPTLVTLHELLPFESTETLRDSLEDRPWGEMRLPRLVLSKGQAMLLLPWDSCYGEPSVEPPVLNLSVLPVGEPFSRLWFQDGTWKPVRASGRGSAFS